MDLKTRVAKVETIDCICFLQAFHGVVSDIVGIAAGKTKAPSASASISEEGSVLSEAEHLHVSV